MECDIHIALEKFVDEKWVMVERIHEPSTENLPLFAALGEPAGFPADASESTILWNEEWKDDSHSHSFMYVVDAAPIFLDNMRYQLAQAKKNPYDFFFNIMGNDNPYDYRIVFWFDN